MYMKTSGFVEGSASRRIMKTYECKPLKQSIDTDEVKKNLPALDEQDALMTEGEKAVASISVAAAIPAVDVDTELVVDEDDH